jgi:hypothetical protein
VGQVNVNYPDEGPRSGYGVGTVVGVLVALLIIAFLVWAFALGGMRTTSVAPSGAPAVGTRAPASSSGSSVNVAPSVNVNPPAGSTSGSGTASGGTSSTTSGSTSTSPTGPTAPSKP